MSENAPSSEGAGILANQPCYVNRPLKNGIRTPVGVEITTLQPKTVAPLFFNS